MEFKVNNTKSEQIKKGKLMQEGYLSWKEAYEKALACEEQTVVLTVAMMCEDEAKSKGKLLELTKAFPLVDMLVSRGKKVTLNIKKCDVELKTRILPLIFLQAIRWRQDANITFLYDGCPLRCEAGPYDKEKYKPFFSKANPEERYSESAKKILQSAYVLQETAGDFARSRILLVNELMDAAAQDSLRWEIQKVNRRYGYEISFGYKQEYISNILPTISVADTGKRMADGDCGDIPMDLIALNVLPRSAAGVNEQLSHLLYLENNIERYIENTDIFRGYQDSPLKDEEKSKLLKDFFEKYNSKKMSISFLGRLIWLGFLRNMIESRELLVLSETVEGGKEWVLNAEAMERSALSCASYAEGLYQIIENSCLYSCGQRAYFGARIYRMSLTGNTGENLSRAQTKMQLYEKYRNCYKESPEDSTSPLSVFSRNYPQLLEFYVLDDASCGEGIIRQSHITMPETDFRTLSQLIDYQPKYRSNLPDAQRRYGEKIAHHYGMRVFFKHIERNDGCVILSTPSAPDDRQKQTLYFSRKIERDDGADCEPHALTSYRILVPLFPMEDHITFEENTKIRTEMSLPGGRQHFVYRFSLGALSLDTLPVKEDRARLIRDAMQKTLQSPEPNCMLAINAYDSTVYESELLAKALFMLVTEYCVENELKIAVLFARNSNSPQEFIRIFSSFYDKLFVEDEETRNFVKTILGNLQIAVCTKPEDDNDDAVSVNFVLAGKYPGSAYISARDFLYVNFDACASYIPLLKYLSLAPNIERKSEYTERIFPFDVYLTKSCFEKGETIAASPQKDCLFLDRMNTILYSDLQLHSDGCRIPDIHIRLGSKIHLDCFYEAELLFRSIGNIQKLAYIIANDLLARLSTDVGETHIMLVGYEKYSAELILQISEFLGKANFIVGAFLIPATGDERNQCIELVPFRDNETLMKDDGSEKTELQLVTVIPVGSTMSTIYKVKHTAISRIADRNVTIKDFRNYCIVAVNSQIMDKKEEDNITWCYWKEIDPEEKIITVLPDRNDKHDMTVQYLLAARASWLSPLMIKDSGASECKMCRELRTLSAVGNVRSPLLQVDKTSMVPTSIFKLRNSGTSLLQPKSIAQNRKRLEQLKGHLEYGHICQGNSHYQFHIDHTGLYQKNGRQIDKWLDSVKIDASAFNIVISPNDTDNIQFVNAALKHTFKNSLRFLHIDINNAYREDIRLKFSKIADEYKYLRLNMPSVKFHIYYISNTIGSEQTIGRARLLVRTLLDESGIAWPFPYIFEKVILMVCRSSFSTMRQYVRFPNSQVEAYIQLNIPQYNIGADQCPACRLQEEYSLLRKRSATIELGQSFERLADKNQKRSLSGYRQWQAEDVLTNHSYYSRLKSWLFFHDEKDDKKCGFAKEDRKILCRLFEQDFAAILFAVTKENEEATALEILRGNAEMQENFKRELHKRSLKDLEKQLHEFRSKSSGKGGKKEPPKMSDREWMVDIVRKTVICDHNYMRLFCLQRAYEELLPLNADECADIQDMNRALYQRTRAKMIEMMTEPLREEPHTKEEFAENAEWLISYIKVLSREHLSRYYHIRKAIVNIMYDMLAIIAAEENFESIRSTLQLEDNRWGPIIYTLRFYPDDRRKERSVDNTLCAALQYELFMTLVHRLSVLQCNIVYQEKALNDTIEGFSFINDKYFNLGKYKLSDGADELLKFTELPPMQSIIGRYIKSIKTATMLTANDDPCYQLLEGGTKDA